MKLVLHIGFHKTGTSAIQAFCRENRTRLTESGILYPEIGIGEIRNPSTPSSEVGHRKFAKVLVSPTKRKAQKVIEDIIKEAESYGNIHTIVISSETFSAPKVKISSAAQEVLKKYFSDIKILLYLRRQDDWADSFYKEVLCWSGRHEKRSFRCFKNEFLPEWLDYSGRLDKWAQIFGQQNIIVKSYDDRQKKNIIEDFFSQLGLEELSPDIFRFPGYSNPSLPAELVPMMLEINTKPLSGDQRSIITNRIFKELSESEYRVPKKPVYHSKQEFSFAKSYSQDNINVCNLYHVDNNEYLTYRKNKNVELLEPSLLPQQIQNIISMADDMARENKDEKIHSRVRENHGHVSIFRRLSTRYWRIWK